MSKANECPKAATGHAWVLNVKPNVCLFCGAVKGQKIAVDKGVPLPKERKTKSQEKLDRAFKAYAREYKRIYGCSLDRYEVVSDASSPNDGFVKVFSGSNQMGKSMSLQRMKQLTGMMKSQRAEV